MRRLLALPLLALATAAPPLQLPAPQGLLQQVQAVPDDRRFGHFPYADVGRGALVPAPAGFAVGQPCLVQPAVAAALGDLLAAKAAAGIVGDLRGVSCYRSIAHQQSVYCRRGRNCRDGEARARLVAPPGYSEHETGYAIDFAVRPAAGCRDVDPCIASTPVGLWLVANAPRFGFEESFPAGNRQGVGWEPWHWRWVGVDAADAAAKPARTIFAAARTRFPAFPAVPPLVVAFAAPAPPVALPALTPPPVPAHGRMGRRNATPRPTVATP